MQYLHEIVTALDQLYSVKEYGKDGGFSRFLPPVYDAISFDWKHFFEEDFTELFNGLMIRGADIVNHIFLAVFPTDHVLEVFIEQSIPGDLLFMHHPLLMECGDPRGLPGKGFVPIKETYLKQMKEKNLSIYTCHGPMDFHQEVGTSVSIAKRFEGKIVDSFGPKWNDKPLGLICEIPKTTTQDLIAKAEKVFDIPYVDFEGVQYENIEKIAILAGCGDVVQLMKEAEEKGAQAYLAGEIHCHIDNDYGRYKYGLMMDYVKETTMSLIGVSHSSSEYLVKKDVMKDVFDTMFETTQILIPQEKWWL
ncbi:Nif3-like dinuclear metal center hexameric protein [Microbacteriaceae bacterium 4G12]